jgi:hypothetical protein
MKKLTFTLLATALAFSLFANNASDTIIVLENRQIQVIDDENRLRVRVFEVVEDGDDIEKTMVFEGHYRGGKTIERRLQQPALKLEVPLTTPFYFANKKFDPSWAGFGFGFNSFIDNNQNLNYVDGSLLNIGRSMEWTLNFYEQGLPITRNFAFVTGLGMKWNRYHLSDQSLFFDKEDDRTDLFENDFSFTRTRLGVNSFTLPLLLEWQLKMANKNHFFVSAGVVGNFNYRSASKVRFVDERGKNQRETIARDLYVRPFTYDFLLNAGFKWGGLYMKYSPMELFENGKGPKVQPVSLGMMLHF